MVISLTYYLIFVTLSLCAGEVEPPEKIDPHIGASTLHSCFPREPIKGDTIPATRTMIMIFNDSERGINTTLTLDLAIALYQIVNSGPQSEYCILTSFSLLQNIVFARTFAQTVYEDLIKKIKVVLPSFDATKRLTPDDIKTIKSAKVTLSNQENDLLNEKIYPKDVLPQLALYTFHPDQWTIYEVNSFLYLLIPERLNDTTDQYILGLKTESLKSRKISYEQLEKQLLDRWGAFDQQTSLSSLLTTPRPRQNDYSFRGLLEAESVPVLLSDNSSISITPATYIKPSNPTNPQSFASSIFFTRQEYKKENKLSVMPQWAFYVLGHGRTNKIASLSVGNFQSMLNFFEQAILTRLCIITSCLASGINSEQVYHDNEESIKRSIFSFPIITVASYDMRVIVSYQINSLLPFKHDLPLFASKIQQPIPVKYDTLLPHLFPSLQMSNNNQSPNIPLLRPPQRTSFFPLFGVIEITKLMTQTREKIFKVSSLYNTIQNKLVFETPIVLLRTDIIPFTLDLTNLLKVPYFVAGMAGKINYYIQEIKTDFPLTKLILSFTGWYKPKKRFLIKKINLEKQEMFTLTNVLIYTEEEGRITHIIGEKIDKSDRKIIHLIHNHTKKTAHEAEASAEEIETYKNELQEFSTLLPKRNIRKLEHAIEIKRLKQPLLELQQALSLLNFIAANY